MLVLTRKTNEELIIGGNIRVVVLGMNRHKVRLGIEAPADISVDRKEIHDQKKAENHVQEEEKADA